MNLIKYWLRRLMEDPEEREKRLEQVVMRAAQGVTATMELSKPTPRGDNVAVQPLLQKSAGTREAVRKGQPATLQRLLVLLRVYDGEASAQ
jgi:hypothetical protein